MQIRSGETWVHFFPQPLMCFPVVAYQGLHCFAKKLKLNSHKMEMLDTRWRLIDTRIDVTPFWIRLHLPWKSRFVACKCCWTQVFCWASRFLLPTVTLFGGEKILPCNQEHLGRSPRRRPACPCPSKEDSRWPSWKKKCLTGQSEAPSSWPLPQRG